MESVEEICDHIALINKAETILEGPIEKIKKQFTNNTYEVITAKKELKEGDCFTIINKKGNTFRILLKEGESQQEVLQNIIKGVEIISFKKETPSMEEIFIKAVSNA
jgi:ABC-2 type transport system ATP-binding protein